MMVSILLQFQFNSESKVMRVFSHNGQLCFCLNNSVLWVSLRYFPISKALFTYAVGLTNIEFKVSSLTGTRYLHMLDISSLVRLRMSRDDLLIVPFAVLSKFLVPNPSFDIDGDSSHTLCVSDFL